MVLRLPAEARSLEDTCDKYSQCTRLPQAANGDTCTSDSQCPGDVRCSRNTCGGQDAYCNGDSSLCAPNCELFTLSLTPSPDSKLTCSSTLKQDACLRNGYCSSQPPRQLDEACIADEQCPGESRCTRGECGALGGYCSANTDCGANREYTMERLGLYQDVKLDQPMCHRLTLLCYDRVQFHV